MNLDSNLNLKLKIEIFEKNMNEYYDYIIKYCDYVNSIDINDDALFSNQMEILEHISLVYKNDYIKFDCYVGMQIKN